MGNRPELISDTEICESGPAVDIRVARDKKTVALVGKIPSIHYGGWNLIDTREIAGTNRHIATIIKLARSLIEELGTIQDPPVTAMGNVNVQFDSATGKLVIKAAKPITSRSKK